MSVETVLARLLFPPHKLIPAKPTQLMRTELAESGLSPCPLSQCHQGRAPSAPEAHRGADSLGLPGPGQPPQGSVSSSPPRAPVFLSPGVPRPLSSLPLPTGSWEHSSGPWSPKACLSSLGPPECGCVEEGGTRRQELCTSPECRTEVSGGSVVVRSCGVQATSGPSSV